MSKWTTLPQLTTYDWLSPATEDARKKLAQDLQAIQASRAAADRLAAEIAADPAQAAEELGHGNRRYILGQALTQEISFRGQYGNYLQQLQTDAHRHAQQLESEISETIDNLDRELQQLGWLPVANVGLKPGASVKQQVHNHPRVLSLKSAQAEARAIGSVTDAARENSQHMRDVKQRMEKLLARA